MELVFTLAGIALIAVGLQDIFHTLLHPSGKGHVSQLVLSGVWKASRATGHRLGSAVGPVALVAAIVLWVALQGVGWALVFYPHVPGGFMYANDIDPAAYSDVAEALYISFVTLSTLGYGDVVATDPWIRMAIPFEALTGFAVLTAALTWFNQVHPPLLRRRALALELKGLADVAYAEAVTAIDAVTVARVLDSLTAQLHTIRVDLSQHKEGFYFQEQTPDLSLARQLCYALRLGEKAMKADDPGVRLSAQQLSLALEQLAAKLRDDFVHTGECPQEIFAAYAADHRQKPRT